MIFKEGDEAEESQILTEGRAALEMEVQPVLDGADIPTAMELVTSGEGFRWSALVEP